MSAPIHKGSFTIYRGTGGTDRQWQWVSDAVDDCGYDLSLLANVSVTVNWQDPLPASSDIGHAHSYMVTEASGQAFTTFIATWADDPGNPNNQGLPDPAADIYDFYKQSFVHELGHVTHFTTITTDTERTAVAGLFWTPDNSGGAGGRRYGTLADWSVTEWAANIKEAIAETFKVVYYKGRLIYGNRTVWHIDSAAWPRLWQHLIPPLAALYATGNPSPPQGYQEDVSVPTQFGLTYLDQAIAQYTIGDIFQPPYLGSPPLPGNRNGTATLTLFASDTPLDSIALLRVSFNFTGGNNPQYECDFVGWQTGPPNGSGSLPGAGENIIGPFQLEIIAHQDPNAPGSLAVDCYVNGQLLASEAGLALAPNTQLRAEANLTVSQLYDPVEVNFTDFRWGVQSSIGPPPYPFASSEGIMNIGQGLRGAVRLGG